MKFKRPKIGMPGDLVLREGGEDARERVPGTLIRIVYGGGGRC